MYTRSLNRFVPIAVTTMIGLACFSIDATAASAEHVIVIGIDALSPDGIAKARTPNMDRMMKEGAYTLHARGVMPTVSSPNWASMIMGAGPEQHGITSNRWRLDKFEIEATVKGSGGIFPTMFTMVRQHQPDAVIGCFLDWGDFDRLFDHSDVNVIEKPEGPKRTTKQAAKFFKDQSPALLFVHLDHVDHAGHSVGHGTAEYYAAVEEADEYIGEILDAVRDAGLGDSTAVIVTSDHGGKGKGHGGATMAEIEIPWIIVGPSVRRGAEIGDPVNTYDTAATVVHLLGADPHPAWIAKPVLGAFED